MGRKYNKFTLAGHNPIGAKFGTGIKSTGGDVKESQDKVIEAAKSAWEVHEIAFKNMLRDSLLSKGFTFNNTDFDQFVAEHITCANHEGTKDNSVYLDFVDLDNRGELLFTYSSAVSAETDPNTGEIIIKIG